MTISKSEITLNLSIKEAKIIHDALGSHLRTTLEYIDWIKDDINNSTNEAFKKSCVHEIDNVKKEITEAHKMMTAIEEKLFR